MKNKRNPIAKSLTNPKYRHQVVLDKHKKIKEKELITEEKKMRKLETSAASDEKAYSKPKESTQFEVCYICHNVLPEKIMYTTMTKESKPYFD